jgi:DNA polymerase I-like protein with 3'-5' exonuclease and polymerase domains
MRGRYTAAVAAMEWRGVPVDADLLDRMRARWSDIRKDLIDKVDSAFGVFEGESFRAARFERYVIANRIPWPRLESGALALDDDTFRDMVKCYPGIAPLRELRHALSGMRLNDLAVGRDGRNRTLLSMFRSRTGRNQPSNSQFIFGPAVWLRSLITPVPGTVLVHADFSAQEIAIAAALSGDERMIESYATGDPYLAFAKQAKLVPAEATKLTHGVIRDRCKSVVLGVLYGMQADSMAARVGIPRYDAVELIRLHHETYRTFWRWVEANLVNFELTRRISTVFGWRLNAALDWRPTALLNWPMQANGAEMLRAACVSKFEAGIGICAPIHDATLSEGPDSDPEGFAEGVRDHMRRAGRLILGGIDVRSDVKVIRVGERYSDKRGEVMWNTVTEMLR